MGQIAQHAGLSRQALYLHFADRASLFVEVSRMADAAARTPDRQRRVDQAPTAREALREAIALQARLKPELRGIATALDVLRRTDPAADAAWKEREHFRLQRCETVVTLLHAEGDLAAAWDVPTAARLLWAVTSQRVWDDFVVDQGWSTGQYRTPDRHARGRPALSNPLTPLTPPMPVIPTEVPGPGRDLAGTVEQVGSGVRQVPPMRQNMSNTTGVSRGR